MTPSQAPRAAAVAVTLAALLASASRARAAPAAAPARPLTSAAAESLFVAGRFDEADAAFAAILERAPKDTLALARRGALALDSNRLDQAKALLERARAAGAAAGPVSALLGEAAYRRDDFAAAAPLFRAAGHEAKARKLESFAGRVPWRIEGPAVAIVPFVQTDPLPLVEMKVNGRGPYLFLIDTGGGELILDPPLADSIAAPRFGSEVGTFAGGKKSDVVHSRLDLAEIGGITIHDMPMALLDTGRFRGVAGGGRVAGVIGTIFLDHFRATLDYPRGRLVLARRGAAAGADSSAGRSRIEVPFRMVGDHYMVARGAVDSSGTLTWFVDSGLAGAAFTAPEATMREARIAIPDTTRGMTGQGGGGAMHIALFRVYDIRLGEARTTDLLGVYGAFPPALEYGFGFRIAGIISHAFLRGWSVTFDFDRMKILFDRAR